MLTAGVLPAAAAASASATEATSLKPHLEPMRLWPCRHAKVAGALVTLQRIDYIRLNHVKNVNGMLIFVLDIYLQRNGNRIPTNRQSRASRAWCHPPHQLRTTEEEQREEEREPEEDDEPRGSIGWRPMRRRVAARCRRWIESARSPTATPRSSLSSWGSTTSTAASTSWPSHRGDRVEDRAPDYQLEKTLRDLQTLRYHTWVYAQQSPEGACAYCEAFMGITTTRVSRLRLASLALWPRLGHRRRVVEEFLNAIIAACVQGHLHTHCRRRQHAHCQGFANIPTRVERFVTRSYGIDRL